MYHFRKLLVYGLNEAVLSNKLSLIDPAIDTATDEQGHIDVSIGGLPSLFLWHSISAGELRISVWWDYKHSEHPQANLEGNARERFSMSKPLAKRSKYSKFVGGLASGWLERKTGIFIQGHEKRGIYDTYLRRGMKSTLNELDTPIPNGYKAEGQFFL